MVKKLNISGQNLSNALRKLWEQHVMWTRSFVISTAASLGDLEFVTERLLRNPTDFAEVLKMFYDEEKAKRFEDLLRDHLLIAANIVNSAKAGDTANVETEKVKWYKNADDIAKFLSEINPHWDQREWQKMLYKHLEILESEVEFRLTGQYERDVKLFDEIEHQALEMADYMYKGISEQFLV